MPGRAAALAKLTPPRLHAVTRRERLFAILREHHRHHALIWVAGPPGAGKTSLVASYLAEHRPRTLWYHVDPGDADLATFFHYLAQAAQAAAGRKKLRLPALTPEFMADVPGFTRRFMRELWAKVPVPATVVFDNYQDLPAGATLHAVLPIALAEFPVEATLAVISRGEPPSTFARELTHNMVGHIRWENLRLTLEETRSLASSVPGLDHSTIASLHKSTNGWMAGTILMLEKLKANGILSLSAAPETMAEVFQYFDEHIFARADLSTREVLMRTALLPWVTGAIAEAVSDHPVAAQIIRDLYQRGLFVDRRADEQVRYQYHDLFREFLLDRCYVHYEREELSSLKRTAAKVAEKYRQVDTAVDLYAETQAWDELSRLICEIGEAMLAQGRFHTLQRYISLLPSAEQQQRPWLLYWSGMSRLVFDPVTARADLEAAYQQFERTGDNIEGMFLSSSAIIESYHCCADDMSSTIVWGDRLHQLLLRHKAFPTQGVQAAVMTNLQGLMLACPHHPLLLELEMSLDQVLHSLENPALRLGVAAGFMYLPLWKGDFSRVRRIVDDVNSHIQGVNLPPLSLLIWRVMEANYAWNISDRTQAKKKLQGAAAIAEEFGIHVFKPMVLGIQTYNALAAGDHREGKVFVDLLSRMTLRHQRLALGQCSYYRAGLSFMSGDLKSAYDHALLALNTTAPLCLPFITGNIRVGLAKVLVELNEREKAQEQLSIALEGARLIGSRTMEVHSLLTAAELLLKEGQQQEAKAALEAGLRVARDLDYVTLDYWWRPKVMAELLAHALAADIEVEYVRSVIRRRNLSAPSPAVKHWPYPVKISTLGRFEIVIDDDLLTTAGKTQRKPLELLKYLCATGTQGINQEDIEEALWPEADGEAADQAFRTTLHRLRKLLRHDGAVQLSDRHVSFDPSLVSVDHLAFDCMTQNIDRSDAAAIERTLALYRGHFLQGETAAWALSVRERLRARFLDLTERLGALLEERGEVGEATQTYLRALEVEPVAEVMCRRVMMTYVRLGRRPEAIGVYQRFSQALRTKLGVPPAPETISLYHDITKI